MLWLLIALYLCLINLLTYMAWGRDKSRAIHGQRRIPESTLLGLCALGGWPLAMVGTRVFRHKSSKTTFIGKLYLIVVVQTALLCYMIVTL